MTKGLAAATIQAATTKCHEEEFSEGPQQHRLITHVFSAVLCFVGFTGLSYLTGYPDQISNFMSFAYPDALAGVLGAGAVIAALRHRQKTGEGMHIDLSQRFSDLPSRWQNQVKLDEIIAEWTGERDHYRIMTILQKAGLAAGAVLDMKELYNDPHLKEREFFKAQTHPEAGTLAYKGRPIRLTKTPLRADMPAPCLGEHNSYIYGTLLGMPQKEINELEEEGIIGTIPASRELQFT